MIAVPHHDCPMPGGDPTNWFRVTGAPHRLTPERLTEAAAAWRSRFSGVTRPMVALLVGGATRQHPFPDDMAADLGRRVAGAARQRNGSVVLATSRRTGPSATRMLLQAIGHGPHVLWGDPSANSYVGLLALADAIVVTGDSVSMCSEACANDKPVYIAAQAELTAPKHRRLHDDLYRRGLARPFADVFDEWSHAPLNAAQDVARRILELM
jgi:mitochondrial fission protein ELM1